MQTNLRDRVKNFAAYTREFGMRGAIQIVNNRRSNHKISTVYCPQVWSKLHYRRGTADFGQLRRIIGRLDMPRIHVDRGLIVDAGANVGYTTALFAHWSPKSQVVAIEPDTSNFETLCLNTQNFSNVRAVNGCLWHRPAQLAIVDKSVSTVAYQFSQDPSGKTQAHTVQQICEAAGSDRINLLKMDIEGAEREIFRECSRDIVNLVDFLLVELHERYAEGTIAAFGAMLNGVPHSRERWGEYELVHITR